MEVKEIFVYAVVICGAILCIHGIYVGTRLSKSNNKKPNKLKDSRQQRRVKKAAREREEEFWSRQLNEQMSREYFAASKKEGVLKNFIDYFKPTASKPTNKSQRSNSIKQSTVPPRKQKKFNDSGLGEFVDHQPSNGAHSTPKKQSSRQAAKVKKPKAANNSSRGFQIVRDIFGKTKRNLQSKLNSSLIVNHKWTYILDDFVLGTILFKPGGDLLLIDPSGSASKGKWELLHALDAIGLEFDGELTVMGYELIDEQGAIMLLSAHGKIHLFVNDAKMDNRETIRTISAAMSWFND